MIQPDAEVERDSPTVVVVEDEVLIRMMVCEALREQGLRVIEASNADDALAYVLTDPSVRLVFSDVRMPGSMDGLELAQRVRARFPDIALVLTSGHLTEGDLDAGTLLLPKPYLMEDAVRAIQALLPPKDSQTDIA